MSESFTTAWHTEQLASSTPYTQVLLRTAMADRYFGMGQVPDLGSSATYFDAAVDFDADVYFNGGFEVVEASARLLAISAVEESAEPSQAEILSAFGQSQRGRLWFELDNGDRLMSKLVGEEYLLRQTAVVEFSFPGLEPANVMTKYRGLVMRYTLTKRSLRIEVETL